MVTIRKSSFSDTILTIGLVYRPNSSSTASFQNLIKDLVIIEHLDI